jgi:Multiubiquitin
MDNTENKEVEVLESKKEYAIIVNGREKIWSKKEISFDEIIILAFGEISPDPNVIYTVTYKYAHGHHGGILVKGDEVKVKDRMVFNVTQTNKS